MIIFDDPNDLLDTCSPESDDPNCFFEDTAFKSTYECLSLTEVYNVKKDHLFHDLRNSSVGHTEPYYERYRSVEDPFSCSDVSCCEYIEQTLPEDMEEGHLVGILGFFYSNHSLYALNTTSAFGLNEGSNATYFPILTYRATSQMFFQTEVWIWTTMSSEMDQTETIVKAMKYYGWEQAVVLTETDSYSIGLAFFFSEKSFRTLRRESQLYFKDTLDPDAVSHIRDRIIESGIKIVILFSSGKQDIGLEYLINSLNNEELGYEYTFILSEAIINYYLRQEEKPTFLQGHLAIRPYCNPDLPVNIACHESLYRDNIYHAIQMIHQYAFRRTCKQYYSRDFIIDLDENVLSLEVGRFLEDGNLRPVGRWRDSEGLIMHDDEADVPWPGNLSSKPSDGTEHLGWDSSVAIVGVVLLTILLILVIITTSIIIWKRDFPLIRQSSPLFLILILVGLLIYSLSLLFWVGYPNNHKCIAKNWFSVIGFGLSISSIISKTWRVRMIFVKSKSFKIRVITNLQLAIYMSILMAPYLLLLVIWTALIETSDPIGPSYGVFIPNTCDLRYPAFLILIMIYSFILVVVMIVLSIQTRKIPSGYRESFWIHIMSYAIAMNAAVATLLSFILYNNVFLVVMICSIVAQFSIWGLLYIPKLYVVLWNQDAYSAEKTSSTGGTELK